MIPTLASYLPWEDVVALCKCAAAGVTNEAEESPVTPPEPTPPAPQPQSKPSVGGTLLAHAAGLGLGTAGGYLGGKAADWGWQKLHGGQKIPGPYLAFAAPAIGGAMGLAYTLAKAHEMEELQRALKNPDDKRSGGPG